MDLVILTIVIRGNIILYPEKITLSKQKDKGYLSMTFDGQESWFSLSKTRKMLLRTKFYPCANLKALSA